jgi:hypothetical protein
MRFFLWVSIIFGLLFSSCNTKENLIIPKNTFKNILIEVHLADGIYMHNYSKYLFHSDSINFYNDIFKLHGYSKTQFDSTLKWYTNHPKQFEAIYNDVVNELNKLEQQYIRLRNLEEDTSLNVYKGKKTWIFPKDGVSEKIPFNIRIKDSATYTVYVLAKVFSDDKTPKPRITAYYWTNNGTKEGKRDYFPEATYQKSSRYVLYSTNLTMPNKKITHLKGYILDFEEKKSFNKHIEIKAIYITNRLNDY